MATTATEPLYDAPRVGGDILFRCTRCKMELAHVIMSMVKDKPAKIQCKTCKSERKYRRTTRKSATAANTTVGRRLSSGALWEEKLAANPKKSTVSYSPKSTFKQGDVVKHVNFGVGIVEDMRGQGKILVLFRDGEKILVHGLS